MSAEKSKIEQAAYRIWEEEGRPEGRDLDHWLQAEAQAGGAKAPAIKAEKPKAAAKPKAEKVKADKPKAAPKAKAVTPKAAKAPAAAAKA